MTLRYVSDDPEAKVNFECVRERFMGAARRKIEEDKV